jgi:hypothetical protein
MTQQLIEWMEERIKSAGLTINESTDLEQISDLSSEIFTLRAVINKAKELQAAEQCKWAVVHESAIFSDLEQAVKEKEDLGGIQSDYTIVKIIEP